ncbi:hypothetical protein ACSBR1_000268 [Camellia fascicularis]
MSSSSSATNPFVTLPLKKLPSGYGFPIIREFKELIDYYGDQRPDEFFRSQILNSKSTVLKTKMKSTSLTIREDSVVLVLDAISFPILFDTSKIKKITGSDDFFSSLAFIGRYLCICLDDLFTNLETELVGSKNEGHVGFISLNDRMRFDFVFRLFCDDKSPSDTAIGSIGPELVDKWQNYDMAMLQPFGLRKVPRFLKDFARNMNLIPDSFFTSNYNKLYDAFEVHAKPILDEAVRMGIKRDEACHNLAWFSVLIKWVGLAGKEVHKQLANEIKSIVNSTNGVTFAALNKMALSSSVVYEALRIEPPFPFQYGRVRELAGLVHGQLINQQRWPPFLTSTASFFDMVSSLLP